MRYKYNIIYICFLLFLYANEYTGFLYYLVITAMDFAKIKAWVRAFAEKHDLWFQCYDELRIPSIDEMPPSYIDGKMFIDINRFHDITMGVFEYIREEIEEEEWTSVDEIRFFVLQFSDFVNEEALFSAIVRETRKYIRLEQE